MVNRGVDIEEKALFWEEYIFMRIGVDGDG